MPSSKTSTEKGDCPVESPSLKSSCSPLSMLSRLKMPLGERSARMREILHVGIDSEDGLPLNLPSHEVKEQWAYQLRKVLKPGDWLALWLRSGVETWSSYDHDKDASADATDKDAAAPDRIVVDVAAVDFEGLSAEVLVLECPEELREELMPDNEETRTRVGLLELFPALEDEAERAEWARAAEVLDHARFFFSYLWKPWDLNEDEEDWTEEHLENRIDLFRRRNEGGDGRRNWRRIKELEGRFREEVQDELSLDTEDGCGKICPDDPELNAIACSMEINEREEEIRRAAKAVENPKVREAHAKLQAYKRRLLHPGSPCLNLVTPPSATVDELRSFLSEASEAAAVDPDRKVRLFSSAQDAIEAAVEGDAVAVSGEVALEGMGELEQGGDLIGLGPGGLTAHFSLRKEDLARVNMVNVKANFEE